MSPAITREGTAFGRWLDERLHARRMSGRELARRAALSPNTISSWRKGTSVPDTSSILAIAPHLDVPPQVLLDLIPTRSTEQDSVTIEGVTQERAASLSQYRGEVVWMPVYELPPHGGERALVGEAAWAPDQFLTREERARFFAVRVTSDALAPEVAPGVTLIMDPQGPRTQGRPALVEAGGHERLCLLERWGDGWVCRGQDGRHPLTEARLVAVSVYRQQPER